MQNKQYLTIRQVERLQQAGIDLTSASALWFRTYPDAPLAISKEAAQYFFFKDIKKPNTFVPAPTLSDIVETILPATLLTQNNLRYHLSIESAITPDGRRYMAGYVLNTVSEYTEGTPIHIHVTGQHDNALDAVYELIMTLVADNAIDLLNVRKNG